MDRLLRTAFERLIRAGNLRVTTAGGSTFTCGDGTGRPVAIRFTTRAAERAVLVDPELKFGEAYMDGSIVVEQGTIADVLAIVLGQHRADRLPPWARLQWLARYLHRRLQQFNPRGRARRNVAHHYDLDGRLYSLFLDADRQYSCAYFETPDQSLDDAQLAKKRHLAAKLLHGERISACSTSAAAGAGLRSISPSFAARASPASRCRRSSSRVARVRAGEKGLSGANRVPPAGLPRRAGEIRPHRLGRHVRACRRRLLRRLLPQMRATLLDDDGVMLLHSIGRSEGPDVTNPWIAKYIFPGGYIPALSEVLPAIERAGLLVTDIEILRLHYAETLKAWRERFLAHREEAERLYDARFVRMWEFYLAASEMAFREQAMMVFQIQLTKRQGVVPMTRDYIAREEARLRALEGGQRPPLRLAGE